MKTNVIRITIISLVIVFIASCRQNFIAPAIVEASLENEKFLNKISFLYEEPDTTIDKQGIDKFGSKVNIYKDMLVLFSPENLDCGLSDKIKERLKSSKREGKNEDGFVPDIVVNNTSKYTNAIKLEGRGANVLVHYFTYELANGTESKPITSLNSPTQNDFNAINHIDNQNEAYESFYFTLDCSGFFSASAKVASSGGFLGFGKGSIAAEGESTIGQNKSVIVMRVLIHSPLYAAYQGSFMFDTTNAKNILEKKTILEKRLLTLQSILKGIPTDDQVDDRTIFLNSNYEALITSNKGNAGFNGSGKLNSSVEINFTAKGTGDVEAANSVSRKSEYSSYDTYIIEANKDAIPEKITIKKLKDKINEIRIISGISSN